MATFAAAALEGFRAGTEIKDTIVADIDLKQATQEATAEGKGADLFTTYQKAGQMAMQSGNTRVADKFLKQANEFKGEALKQHITELKVHQGEVEALYQDLQGSKTKEDLLGRVNKAAASGRLSEAEKLEYSGAINKLTDEQVPVFIEEFGKKTLDYKQQLDVHSKIVNDAFDHDIKTRTLDNQIERTRLLANKAAGKGVGKPTQEQKDETKLQDKLDAVDTRLETEIAGIEGKDPRKFDATEKARQITKAKNRAQSRKQQLQKRSTAKKPETNKAKVPAYSDWLKAAKEKNPGVSDADLKAYYEKTYKE